MPAGTHKRFEALETNWRRVASTHNLHDLLEADKPPPPPQFSLIRFLLGLVLIIIGAGSFLVATFAMIVGPWLPPSSSPFIKRIQADEYYHLLIPLTVPVTIIAIAVNWFSMKLFKHNR